MPGALARLVRNKRGQAAPLGQFFSPGTMNISQHTIDSYPETNGDEDYSLYTGYLIGIGQSFAGDGSGLGSVKFYMSKGGSPTGNIIARLYAITGTHGVNGKPTGSALASSNAVDSSTLSTTPSNALVTFTFASPYTLLNGIPYVITCEFNGGDASNKVIIVVDKTSPSHGGNFSYSADYLNWTASIDYDVCFYAIST